VAGWPDQNRPGQEKILARRHRPWYRKSAGVQRHLKATNEAENTEFHSIALFVGPQSWVELTKEGSAADGTTITFRRHARRAIRAQFGTSVVIE
jgi:hypothetical protein